MPRKTKTVLVGLGNPGAQYVDTPHNIGYRFIDIVNHEYGTHKSEKSDYIICDIVLDDKYLTTIQPLTFMNLSGQVLKHYKDYDVFVFCDDCHTKIGNVKHAEIDNNYRGTHNGLRSITQYIKNFQVLLLGVGNDRAYKMSDYVLTRMSDINIQKTEQLLLKLSNDLPNLLDAPGQYIKNLKL